MIVQSLTLSARNILRNRRRTVITLVAIVTGALAILLFGGYANSIVDGVQTGFVRQLGHLQVQKQGYFLVGTGSPSDYGIANYEEVARSINADPELRGMVKVVTPILQLHGIAGNFSASVSRTVAGIGVVPADQNRLRQWNDYDFPGEIRPIALPENQDAAAVVGHGLARTLRVCSAFSVPSCPKYDNQPEASVSPGSPATPEDLLALSAAVAENNTAAMPAEAGSHPTLEILAATSTGAPNVASVPIVAAESQGIKEVDDMFVALPLAVAQRLVYGNATPQATSLVVQLHHTDQIASASARLKQLIEDNGWDLEVVDFRQINATYDQIRGLFTSIFGFIAILMGTIVLFSVANTMSMAVMERTAEIGTVRSLGLCRGGVYEMFMIEGLLIGVLGAGLGTAVALSLAALINSAGLTWIPPGQVDPIPLVIHVFNDPALIVGAFVGLVAVAALSSLLPARRAARMEVVDALRHV